MKNETKRSDRGKVKTRTNGRYPCTLSTPVSSEMYELLQKISIEQDVFVSTIARKALNAYLNKLEGN